MPRDAPHIVAAEALSRLSESGRVHRAMELSKGTVSVVDSNGVTWTRIWCKCSCCRCVQLSVCGLVAGVYELYHSLVGSKNRPYTFDM